MTKQKMQDILNSTPEALLAMANEQRTLLLELRMQQAGSSLKNVKQMREVRKSIARILTVLGQKELQK